MSVGTANTSLIKYYFFSTLYTDGQIKNSSNVQQQPPTQVLQSAAVAPVGSTAKIGMFSQFHWYHAILAVGFLAASGAGTAVFLKVFILYFRHIWH